MGQFITVSVQAGASPSVRIFNLNRSITGMAIERYPSVEKVGSGARRTCWPGACSTWAPTRSRCTRARWRSSLPPERWAELEPKVIETIEHLFGYYGDDAGWAPDALRAIGVEPLPTPEPTG